MTSSSALRAEFLVAFAARHLAEKFRLGLEADEGILDQGRIDGFVVDAEHVSVSRISAG